MAFRDPRTENWIVKIRRAGRQILRTVNRKNLRSVGIDLPETCAIDETLADEYKKRLENGFFRDALSEKPRALLSTVINNYLSSRKSNPSRSSLVLKDIFLKFVGDTPIQNLTIEELDMFDKFISEKKSRLNTKYSDMTVFKYIRELKSFLTWAFKSRYFTNNELALHLRLAKPRIEPKYLSQAEADALMEAVKGHPIETIVRLILNTGARRDEVTRMKWSHINLTGKQPSLFIDGKKTFNAKRLVPLQEKLAEYLRTLPRYGEYILTNETNQPITKWALSSALRRFQESHPLPFDWHFQKLRKTYGAMLLINGYKIEIISRFLGHADIRITQQWYVRLTQEDIFKTMPEKQFAGF